MRSVVAAISLLVVLPRGATLPFAGGGEKAPAVAKPLVIDLWPGKAPDEPGTIGPEKVHPSPKSDLSRVEVPESTRLITNVTKPAKVETGAEFIVPAFVDIGNVIKIDTRTGEYLGRAST